MNVITQPESNDRNKTSTRPSAYDKVSKYAATGIKVAGIIGIICCIIIGRLRTNTGKGDSTIPSVTLDKQYQECVKANE